MVFKNQPISNSCKQIITSLWKSTRTYVSCHTIKHTTISLYSVCFLSFPDENLPKCRKNSRDSCGVFAVERMSLKAASESVQA